MDKYWVGAEYMVSGDGHRIVLESLKNYMIKLEDIQSLRAGAGGMFEGLVRQEAAKRIPQVNVVLDRVQSFLIGSTTAQSLIDDIPIINSALDSYRSDLIQTRSDTNDAHTKSMIDSIDEAKQAINKFE
ncbi:MAG: hypothetical protein F4W68_06790 [Cenarchaeum sp. SB0661_bin_35]|nr:hypothetical protein [Cenarchaeum sp. SB0667_bin_13]MYC80184.1 hypothetical protein [Cenarchaeum sp. SB0661_bin_35]MYD59221.1 hypothetical protein [Cenarchaeum sp. SB0678_bin_8]